MDKLYQEGGLADDGTDIEPVTGNEVPTGSLDQEVRDNIPAQLSEGEYVVPADVVRYYGVKFFEDLRGQAKQDFARMEAEGRVGGEPVDSTGMPMEEDEELSPEEMQMLQEALGGTATGMAMGGMVPQQQQMQYNPYEQQQMQYSQPARQPMFQTTRTVGMQEGGDVGQEIGNFLSGEAKPKDQDETRKKLFRALTSGEGAAKTEQDLINRFNKYVEKNLDLDETEEIESLTKPQLMALLQDDLIRGLSDDTLAEALEKGGYDKNSAEYFAKYILGDGILQSLEQVRMNNERWDLPDDIRSEHRRRRAGMQEGGDVPSFNPSDYSYGGGFQNPFDGDASTAGQGGMQLVEYINPTSGQTRMITVLNGEPIGMVPEGFIPSSPEARKQAQDQNQKVDTKTEGTREGRGPDEGYKDGPSGPSVDKDMKSGVGSIKGNIRGNKVGKGVAGVIGAMTGLGPLGKAFGIDSMMDKNTATQNMIDAVAAEAQGLTDAQEAMEMAESYARDIGLSEDEISDMLGSAIDSIEDAYSGDVEGSQGTTDPMGDISQTGDLSRSQRGGIGAVTSGRAGDGLRGGSSSGSSSGQTGGTGATAGGAAGDGSRGGGGGSSGGRGGQTGGTGATAGGAAGDGSRGGGGSSSSSGDTSGAASGPAGASGTAGAGGPSGNDDAGTPRAKGGLMGDPKGSQRKKPVKNKRKGLASK